MKPTPRRAEREIAKLLSAEFETHNQHSVERIPVLGRTGPDITINDFGLVVDVKSRITVPQSMLVNTPTQTPRFALLPLHNLIPESLVSANLFSKTVSDWLDHMDAWRKEEYPTGISGIVIRRPNMPFGNSVLVIYIDQLEEYLKRWKLH